MNNSRVKLSYAAKCAMAFSGLILSSCAADEVEVVNHGTEITFTTRVSRATEIDIKNFNGFYVYADAAGYPTMFINGDEAKPLSDPDSNGHNSFGLENKYYWPSDVETIRFWAYGPSGKRDEGGLNVTPQITVNSQAFSDVTPLQSLTDGGKDQRDFVVAYTEVERGSATGMAVNLQFNHAFAQVLVNAKLGEEGNRVHVKGAWIMNVASKGGLTFSEESQYDDVNHMKWEPSYSNLTSYGYMLTQPDILNKGAYTPLIGGKDNSSLMLVPQKRGKVTFTDNKADKGAYIMVLCRVEAEHKGDTHVEGEDETKATTGNDAIFVDGDKHYHQLFPAPVNGKFDKDKYGYVCVPVDIEWKPGHKYVYNLVFCGKTSGAGIYPPNPGEGFSFDNVIPTPDGDEGKVILNDPISFDVSVGSWTEITDTPDVQ